MPEKVNEFLCCLVTSYNDARCPLSAQSVLLQFSCRVETGFVYVQTRTKESQCNKGDGTMQAPSEVTAALYSTSTSTGSAPAPG